MNSSLRNKLIFKIPFQTIILIIIIMVIMALSLNIILSKIIQQNAEEKIEFLAEANAGLAGSYLDTMQTRSQSLSVAVYQYRGLDIADAEKPMLSLLNSILEDERIYSCYIALEPNLFFNETPAGLSYYLFRDGSDILLDVNNDFDIYNDGEYYAVTKASLKPHITEPYSYELSTGETIWLITISNPILDSGGKF